MKAASKDLASLRILFQLGSKWVLSPSLFDMILTKTIFKISELTGTIKHILFPLAAEPDILVYLAATDIPLDSIYWTVYHHIARGDEPE